MKVIYRILVVVFLSSSLSFGTLQDQSFSCTDPEITKHGRSPKYRIGSKHYSDAGPKTLHLSLSGRPDAFESGADTVLWACKIATDYKNENAIEALLFDDYDSSKKLALYFTDQDNHGRYIFHLRGRYKFDRDKGIRFVEMLVPEASQDGFVEVRRYKINIK